MATEKALVFVIRANISDFNKALGDAERNFKKTFGNIKNELKNISMAGIGVGAAILAPLALAFKDSTEWAHEIEILSEKIGFSIDETQRWVNMMTLAGGSGADITVMVKKMTAAYEAAVTGTDKATDKHDELSKKLQEAQESADSTDEEIANLTDDLDDSTISSDKASKAFAKLKINLSDFGKLDTEGRLRAIFVALSKITDVNEQQSIVGALLGKGGQKALAAAKGDVEAFLNGMDVMSEDMVRKLAAGREAMEKFDIAWRKMVGTVVAVTFGGDATKGIDLLTEKLNEFSNWVEEHPDDAKRMTDLALAIAGIATAIGVLAGVSFTIVNVAGAFKVLSAAAAFLVGSGALAGWSGAIAVALGVIGGWLAAAGSAIAAAVVALLGGVSLVTVGWIVLIVAAVIAAIWLIIANWDAIAKFFIDLWASITAGFNQLWPQVVAGFTQAKDWVINIWNVVVTWFQELPARIQTAMAGVWQWLTQPFRDAWAEIQRVANDIKSAWDNLFRGGGGTITVTANANVGVHAAGGIFTRPTLGIIGDVPEAVIPLSKLGNMGGGNSTVNVNVGNYIGDDLSKRALVRDLQRIMNEETRRSVHKPTETTYYSPGGHL